MHLVSPIWPSPQQPALGTFVREIATGLTACGWTVSNRAVGASPRGGIAGKVERYLRLCAGAVSLLWAPRGVVFVHLPTWFSSLLLLGHWLRPMPTVVNLHGSEIHARRLLARAFWPLTRLYISRAALVVVPSQTFAAAVGRQTEARRIFVSPSGGYDENVFRPVDREQCRFELGIPRDAFVVGYVSRIVANKGWRVFLDAVALLAAREPRLVAFVVGTGSDEREMRSAIAERGLSGVVKFYGQVRHDELARYYGALDAFLFTSAIAATDTLGLVAIEAMACGTPVVALRSRLTGEYVVPGTNGEFAEEWTGEAFADAAVRAVRWHDGGSAAKQRVAASVTPFAKTQVASDLSRQFELIAGGGDAARGE